MTVYRLGQQLVFPDPAESEPDGLLAVGGDLSPARLLLAYSQGVFPWYAEGLPILWYSPDPRAAFHPESLHVPTSLRKRMRRKEYEIRLDTAFGDVVRRCAEVKRPEGEGTWITRDMRCAYEHLHVLGFAHSAEAWYEGRLVGGLYGVSLGAAFFGESMFADRSDASKVAFVTLVQQLVAWGFDLVDCQVSSHHLRRFGAADWPRDRFLKALRRSLEQTSRRGRWTLEAA